ncbi:MAG: FliA/WhiG family RNA polymerase sigma factor [Desulfohalobiaceae bacterium]
METSSSSGRNCSSGNSPWLRMESGQMDWDDLSAADKDLLVRHYAQKVKIIALRLKAKLPQHIELNELLSAGTLGLVEALGKYESHKGIRFETYAENRIKGAMLDELRRMDWFSRGLRQRVRLLETAALRIEQSSGTAPTPEQLGLETGLRMDEVEQGLAALQNQVCLSLDLIEEKVASTSSPTGSEPYLATSRQELIGMLAGLIRDLTAREKMVLSLYYTEELTMREAAEVMGITEGRVSQLHSQALGKLRSQFRLRYGTDSED